MRFIKSNVIAAAGLAGILTLGICGCTTSTETTTTVSTEVTDDEGNTKRTETTTTNKDGEVETTEETHTVIGIDDWEDAWMGETEAGQTIFYAQSPNGGAQGMFVIYDEDEGIEAFVGDNTTDEEGTYVTTTDVDSGNSFTFGIASMDDGELTIDMGEGYGMVELEEVPMDEMLSELAEVDEDGRVIAS